MFLSLRHYTGVASALREHQPLNFTARSGHKYVLSLGGRGGTAGFTETLAGLATVGRCKLTLA